MKVIAVIPAYNEEKTIADVVKGAKKYCDEVIVVDDCSTDRTPQILWELGIKYLSHRENKGVGAATWFGIKMALRQEADIVVTLDGDGQHNPAEIPTLLKPFKLYGNIGVVIGSRFLNGSKIPQYRRFGIDIVNWLYNFGCKYKVSDSLSGFRAYSREFIKQVVIEENGFGYIPEILIKARKVNFGIVEVPINCKYFEDYKQNSTFNPIKLGIILAWKTIYWRLKLRN